MICFFSSIAWGQWTMANLSEAKYGMASVKFGSKLMYVGGVTSSIGSVTSIVEQYDFPSNSWSTDVMSAFNGGNLSATVTGQWAVFGKSTLGVVGKVFVYDNATNTWETLSMPDQRNDYTLASIGNKVFLAGGKISGAATTKINIYDLVTKEWSEMNFPTTRTGMRAITIGNRVFFVGGSSGAIGYSTVVNVYDNSTDTWSTLDLSQGRTDVALVVLNNKLIVAGGQNTASLVTFSNVVDYIDLNTLAMTSGTMPDDVPGLRSSVVGDKAVFWKSSYTYAFIYDDLTGQWSTHDLSAGSTNFVYSNGAVLGGKLYFCGGPFAGTTSHYVYIYDGENNQWTTDLLPHQRRTVNVSAIVNKVLIAGGENFADGTSSNIVDIYTDSSIVPLAISAASVKNTSCHGGADGMIAVDIIGGEAPYTYTWSPSSVAGPNPDGLPAGTYNVTVADASGQVVTATYEITSPSELIATTDSTNATGTSADGTASVLVNGGTPPYTYIWSDPASSTTMNLNNVTAGDYTVTVTDNNGCTLTATVTVEMTSGTAETFGMDIRLSPTVSSGQFMLYAGTVYQGLDVAVFDAQGKLVQAWKNVSTGTQLSFEQPFAGTYIVRATALSGQSKAFKLVIR